MFPEPESWHHPRECPLLRSLPEPLLRPLDSVLKDSPNPHASVLQSQTPPLFNFFWGGGSWGGWNGHLVIYLLPFPPSLVSFRQSCPRALVTTRVRLCRFPPSWKMGRWHSDRPHSALRSPSTPVALRSPPLPRWPLFRSLNFPSPFAFSGSSYVASDPR